MKKLIVVSEDNQNNVLFRKFKDDKHFENTLFLFNDNIELYFTPFKNGDDVIRGYNRHNLLAKTISAGIPIGSLHDGPYTTLDYKTQEIINMAFRNIDKLIETYKYDKVCYFPDGDGGYHNNKIFMFNEEIKKYIMEKIDKICL